MSSMTLADSTFDTSLPYGVHDPGATVFNHRYLAELIETTRPTTWANMMSPSSGDLTVPSGADAPTLISENGEPILRFDGVNDAMSLVTATTRTIVLVARKPDSVDPTIISTGGLALSRSAAQNNVSMTMAGATGPISSPTGTYPEDKFAIIMFTRNSTATASLLSVNGSSPVFPAGAPTGTINRYALGVDGSTVWSLDIVEMLTADVTLDGTQRTSVFAALTARWAALLAA